jgi:hypothetical protein
MTIKFNRNVIKEGKIYQIYLSTTNKNVGFIPHYTFLLIKKEENGNLIVLDKEGIKTIPDWGYYSWYFKEIEN